MNKRKKKQNQPLLTPTKEEQYQRINKRLRISKQRLLKYLPQSGHPITLHTDQRYHCPHRAWRKLLRKGRIMQIMFHRETCLDNTVCETVFSKLKVEIETDTSYNNQDEFL